MKPDLSKIGPSRRSCRVGDASAFPIRFEATGDLFSQAEATFQRLLNTPESVGRAIVSVRDPGSKDWAYRLVAEFESGKRAKPMNVYRVAHEAIGRPFPEGAEAHAGSREKVEKTSNAKSVSMPIPKHPPIENPWWDTSDDND